MRYLSLCILLALAAGAAAETIPAAAPQATTQPATKPGEYGKPITTAINPGKTIAVRSTNQDISVYEVTPRGEMATHPAVIYVHDIFGMTDFARSQAEALARQGYMVLAPDLYSRVDGSAHGFTDANDAWAAYDKTPDAQIMADLEAMVGWLNKEGQPTAGQPIGVVGHDMGGSFAMKLAGADLRVTAAVNYYGRILYTTTTTLRPISPVEDLFNLHAPLLSFYGTIDPQAPADQIKALESRLQNNPNKTYYHVVRLQDVGHSFLVPTRPGYNQKAAAEAEAETRDFLAQYLRAEPKKDDD